MRNFIFLANLLTAISCGSPNPTFKRHDRRDGLQLTPGQGNGAVECIVQGVKGQVQKLLGPVGEKPACVTDGSSNDGITLNVCLTLDGSLELEMTSHAPGRYPVKSRQNIPGPAVGVFTMSSGELRANVNCQKAGNAE